jgi:hypothetical protein
MSSFYWALVGAGFIGTIVSIIHGIAMHKRMITPILGAAKFPQSTRRLVPLLLHFTTLCWFLGGAALMATPFFPNTASILTTALFVGGFYLFGAVGNFWGTRGRHPGWILLAMAVALIAYASFGIMR